MKLKRYNKYDAFYRQVHFLFSGSPKVAAKTRRKVLAAISELKYVPNEHATTLRRGSDIFAALIPDLNNPYYLGIVRGLRDQCTKQDIVLHISETRHDYEIEKTELRFLCGIQTSGYAFIGTVLDDDLIESLNHSSVVMVDKLFGYADQYPQIIIKNDQCTHQATTYLTGNLEKRIGKLQVNADFIIRDSVRH